MLMQKDNPGARFGDITKSYYKAKRDDSITFMLDKNSWDAKMKFLTPLPDHWGADIDGPNGFCHGTPVYSLAMISADGNLRGCGDNKRAVPTKIHEWKPDGSFTTDGVWDPDRDYPNYFYRNSRRYAMFSRGHL